MSIFDYSECTDATGTFFMYAYKLSTIFFILKHITVMLLSVWEIAHSPSLTLLNLLV